MKNWSENGTFWKQGLRKIFEKKCFKTMMIEMKWIETKKNAGKIQTLVITEKCQRKIWIESGKNDGYFCDSKFD